MQKVTQGEKLQGLTCMGCCRCHIVQCGHKGGEEKEEEHDLKPPADQISCSSS